jgi:SAM-dependent methyltransferase
MSAVLDKLDLEQVQRFNKEYVTDAKWAVIRHCIDARFPSGDFTFLDVGGGNGVFTDRVLSNYPNATGILLDSSDYLIRSNAPHPRKQVILGDVALLTDYGIPEVDIVFSNWVLHHLVTSSSYAQSRRNIEAVVKAFLSILKPGGVLSVCENDFNGFIDAVPGRMIFALTSVKALAPLVKRLGANTAGVGVCFLSRQQWRRTFATCGYAVSQQESLGTWRRRWHRDAPLLLSNVHQTHYWLTR